MHEREKSIDIYSLYISTIILFYDIMKFKTIKQKYMHHNKLEPECKTDKNEIIKMIGLYKKKIFKMLSGKVDKLKSVLKTDVDFINLKTLYEKCESITMDSDFFKSAVGEEFDTLPS